MVCSSWCIFSFHFLLPSFCITHYFSFCHFVTIFLKLRYSSHKIFFFSTVLFSYCFLDMTLYISYSGLFYILAKVSSLWHTPHSHSASTSPHFHITLSHFYPCVLHIHLLSIVLSVVWVMANDGLAVISLISCLASSRGKFDCCFVFVLLLSHLTKVVSCFLTNTV